MNSNSLRHLVLRAVAVSLTLLGCMPFAHAGMLDTQALIEQQAGNSGVARINLLLERQDVAEQLVALGVDPRDVQARVANLTDAEILSLEQTIDQQVAGGDAIGVIGTVFLVLLILELVGVTDIFKSF